MPKPLWSIPGIARRRPPSCQVHARSFPRWRHASQDRERIGSKVLHGGDVRDAKRYAMSVEQECEWVLTYELQPSVCS